MSNVVSSTNVLETLIQLEQNNYKFYEKQLMLWKMALQIFTKSY